MLIKFNNTTKQIKELVELIHDIDEDLYFTENNQRVLVNSESTLKQLLKNSSHILYFNDSEYKGLILVWHSKSEFTERFYIKFIVDNIKTLDKLLMALLWSFKDTLHIKINKQSSYLRLFRNKRFEFVGSRGLELLLERKYVNINNNQ
jgi:hypothetical protein